MDKFEELVDDTTRTLEILDFTREHQADNTLVELFSCDGEWLKAEVR